MVIRVVRDSSLPSEKRPLSSRGRGGVRALTSKHTSSLVGMQSPDSPRRGGGSAADVLVQPGIAWQIAEEGNAQRVGEPRSVVMTAVLREASLNQYPDIEW